MLQFLEAMGYEALLQNYVVWLSKTRLIGQGKGEDLVESAKEIQDRVLQVAKEITGKIFGVNDGAINYAIRKMRILANILTWGNLWLIPNMKMRIPKMKIRLLETGVLKL